jgi:hypothetical protein
MGIGSNTRSFSIKELGLRAGIAIDCALQSLPGSSMKKLILVREITSARIVGRHFETSMRWRYIQDRIQARNLTNVNSAANLSQHQVC